VKATDLHLVLGLLLCAMMARDAVEEDAPLKDKTLVVWAAPATLEQGGGSALTLDDRQDSFDAVVFGEITAKKWMPGSNSFWRTEKDQNQWPEETAGPGEFVQVALVYQGTQITAYRNGKQYAQYTHGNSHIFPVSSVVLFGRRHLQGGKPTGESFKGIIQDARIYDTALDQATIAGLKAGEPSTPEPWAWWAFCKGDLLPDRTGRYSDVRLAGDVRLTEQGLELKGDETMLLAYPGSQGASIEAPPAAWGPSGPVPDSVVLSTRVFRERMLKDPYRPGYHFTVPEDWGRPGDTNGAFYAKGRYHLMYLYNRKQSGYCWGHVSSNDLVHWRHHPDAIGPDDIDEGCYSGGGFIDDDGAVYLSYWMLWGARGLGIAKSSDAHYDHFEKFAENPIIKSTEWGITEVKDAQGNPLIYGSADPTNIWKKDGVYYMAAGNLLILEKYGRKEDAPKEMQGDWLDLFKSTDLKNWEYMHRFYERNPEWTDRSEDNMCPSFLPLPTSAEGGAPSGKHLLLFIAHNRGAQYYVGDYRDDKFYPDNHGRMSWVDNAYFAPEALVDGKGRQIMWTWLRDDPDGEEAKGWSGTYGLPRTLWLGDDGTLRMAPVPELQMLRQAEQTWNSVALTDGETKALDNVEGDSCELAITLKPGAASQCGLKVRRSPGGEEETLLYYDTEKKELVFDATRSGVTGWRIVERAPFELKDNENFELRVFIDKCVIEIYANDRQAICRRVYPGRDDSLGLVLFSKGGRADFPKVSAWDMMPSNPY
jgi:beta-fructofuranosidase